MITGYRAAQLRVIFALPSNTHLGEQFPYPLAYVEYFNTFPTRPDQASGLFLFKRSYRQNVKHAAIVPLTSVHLPCHITPIYSGKSIPGEWTSRSYLINVIDSKGTMFALNPFSSVLFHAMLVGSGSPPIAGPTIRYPAGVAGNPKATQTPDTSTNSEVPIGATTDASGSAASTSATNRQDFRLERGQRQSSRRR